MKPLHIRKGNAHVNVSGDMSLRLLTSQWSITLSTYEATGLSSLSAICSHQFGVQQEKQQKKNSIPLKGSALVASWKRYFSNLFESHDVLIISGIVVFIFHKFELVQRLIYIDIIV